MNYQVRVIRVAQRQLDRLTGNDYQNVLKAILALESEPRPGGCKKLAFAGLWRIRVGRYRVVYDVNDKQSRVMVVRVTKRDEKTYKGL